MYNSFDRNHEEVDMNEVQSYTRGVVVKDVATKEVRNVSAGALVAIGAYMVFGWFTVILLIVALAATFWYRRKERL
jgi:hypothetical protein